MGRQLALVLWFVATLGAQPANQPLFDLIDPSLADLSAVTGLKVKNKVPRDYITRDKLKAFLQQRITDTVKPEEIRVEQLTLQLFGFIPATYNLKESTVSLLTEQAAAFYDYRKKKMFFLEGAPEMSERFVLIHELAHALADQHFNLSRYIQQGRNDDSSTARQAVMEGQAQWLMYEVMAKKAGQSLRTDKAMVKMFIENSSNGMSQYPELSGAPLYIRESLLFPYASGLLFQQAVIDKLGDAGFSAVFQKPPKNTREILHPEVYFAGSRAAKQTLPAFQAKKGYKALVEGDLGEFDLTILLRQFTDDQLAARLAPEWRGGRFRVLEHAGTKHAMLLFTLEFSSDANAIEFRDLYEKQILPKKLITSGNARVLQSGTHVFVTEGLE